MKVIFLDIDGVLNSVDSMIAFADQRLSTKPNYEDRLDSVSIGLLKRVVAETDAKIVISSTWRMGRTKTDFIEIFSRYDWGTEFPVIDMTPIGYQIFELGSRSRGHEIQHWLDNHPEVTEYIILDDDSDMLESQIERFVHVSNISGFRTKHYCQCLRLFGQPDERLESQVNWVKNEKTIV